jgi:Family of unknown function (DUF6763)
MDSKYQHDMLVFQPTLWPVTMKLLSPVVGGWYQDLQTSALFEVVAWDPAAHNIETQYLDGEVTEYDLDAWREMMLQRVEAPEDWRSAYELDDDDALDPDLPYHPEDWNNPVNSIEPEFMHGVDDF